MAKGSGQKFIARNRAPRVQVEYDVELYGAQKSIQLPFVMGVMADLSGKNSSELPGVAERKFTQVDVDNFDDFKRPTDDVSATSHSLLETIGDSEQVLGKSITFPGDIEEDDADDWLCIIRLGERETLLLGAGGLDGR